MRPPRFRELASAFGLGLVAALLVSLLLWTSL